MGGPAPSPLGEGRSLDGGWIVLPVGGRSGGVPKLDGKHLVRARRLWARWWGSPMALMWSVDDVPVLERLLVLSAVVWGGEGSVALLAEVRQLEDRFGLNPQARRKLYWRIEGVDVPSRLAGDLGGVGVGSGRLPEAGGERDPRLRVVDGGKAAG